MHQTKEFIVARLQEILAKEASKHFDSTPLTSDFKAYVIKVTKVVDWEDSFIEEVYELYLQKINETGETLTNNLSSN